MNIEHLTLGIESLVRVYETQAIIDLLKQTDEKDKEKLKKQIKKKQDDIYKIIVAELFFGILNRQGTLEDFIQETDAKLVYLEIDTLLNKSGFYIGGQLQTFDKVKDTIKNSTMDKEKWADVLIQGGLRTQDGERVTTTARNRLQEIIRDFVVGTNQLVSGIANLNLYEVEWHIGARPTHQVWQGQVYDYFGLVNICGLGRADGLLGVNCYHFYIPFTGVRRWPNKPELDEEANRLREYNGVGYTYYQATQKQRQYERRLRKQKQQIDVYKAIGQDTTSREIRYKKIMQEYIDFSNGVDVPMQKERLS